MSSVGTIDLDLTTNTAPFQRQLNGIAGQATSMVGGAFMKLGGIIAAAFAVQKLVEFGKSSIELASNLNEVQNVVDVTFGSMANQINDFAKTAITQFGLSEFSAKKFASTMGAMLKSSGISGQQMTNMSEGIAGLSADMASFYNLKPEEAFDKIRSGIAGETEPLRQLGINMSVANMEAYALSQGIKTSYSKMDQAAQSLLRYNYLMSVSKDAQGDFARTSGSWANQVRLLSEQWNIMKTTMGQGFINMLTPVLSMLNSLIAKLQTVAAYFKAFTEAVWGSAGGTTTSTTAAAAGTAAVGDAATSTAGKVAKAAKAIKGSLGAFDQLNVIGNKSGAGDAGVGGAGAVDVPVIPKVPDIDTGGLDEFKNKVKSTTDAIKLFFANTRAFVEEHKTGIISAIAGIVGAFATFAIITNWTAIVAAFGLAIDGITTALAAIFTPALAVAAAIGLIIAAIVDLWQTDKGFRDSVIQVWAEIKTFMTKVADDTWSIVKQTWDKYSKDIIKGLQDFWSNTKDIIKSAWENVIKPIIQGALETMSWLWDKHLKELVATIANFVGKVIEDALEIYNGFIAPVVNWLIETLGPGFVSVFKLIGDVVGTVVGVLADVAKGIFEILGGIIDFITGVFTGNWSKAWLGVKEIFGGIFDSFGGIMKGAVNLIIDALNFMIRGINAIKMDPPDWAKDLGAKSIGFSIPLIPKLANGGLVSTPTLVMVGDNRNARQDPEVISPLSKLQGLMGSNNNQELVDILKLILAAIKGTPPPSFKIGDTEFAQLVGRAVNNEQCRTGQPLFQL